MISITRSLARQFRAVVRRAAIGKGPGGFGFHFTIQSDGQHLRLRAMSADVAVEYSTDSNVAPEMLQLPLEVLAKCEGRSDDLVTVERLSDTRTCAQWTEHQIPQVAEYDIPEPDKLAAFPTVPEQLTTNDPTLWSALRDAAASASQDCGRYALNCLQLRGDKGQIVATDGGQTLVQSNCAFPWSFDLLIPATKLFGCHELPENVPVAVGRSDDWVTFVLGDWTIWLRIAKDARFPVVESIVPAATTATSRLQLTAEDAEFLVSALPRLPGRDEPHAPATVDLNGQVVIRARAADRTRATELVLTSSRLEGQPIIWQTNRQFLSRAVQLGFREVCLFSPTSPVLCDDGRRQFVWMLLDAESAIRAEADPIRIESPAPKSSRPSIPNSTRRFPTVSPATIAPVTPEPASTERRARKQSATNSRTAIEQVVALRDALKSTVVQANEVIRSLKRQQREARIVQTTLHSLRELQKVAS